VSQALSPSCLLWREWDHLDVRANLCSGLELQQVMQRLAELQKLIPQAVASEECEELARRFDCIAERVSAKKVL
jgi:hypothetical protein